MRNVVQCPSCRNFEYLSNVYCRICGRKLPDAGRERIERAGPWILMVLGIAATFFLGTRSGRDGAAVFILAASFCFILFSHRLFKFAERVLFFREPLLRRLLPVEGAPRKDAERLVRLREKSDLVSVFDRNIGLLLSTVGAGDSWRDDGRVLGHVKKALRYYGKNAEDLIEILGAERYAERLDLFEKMQRALFENTLIDKNDAVGRRYDRVIRRMIDEIDREESNVELERDLLEDT